MKNIQHYHFEQLIKKGYSLDIIYMLKLLKAKVDTAEMRATSKKIGAIYASILRKGLYFEYTHELTLEGDELLKFLDSEAPILVKKKVVKEEAFTRWWGVFPSNNKFVHGGRIFAATRSFKTKKADCKKLFEKLINEKKFTADQIIQATEYDVNMKKDNSVKNGQNELTYLQNSHTYLYQESFEGFVELINEKKPFRRGGGGTNI
jgi:hypothetical protein